MGHKIEEGSFIKVSHDCTCDSGLVIPDGTRGIVVTDYGKALEVQFVGIKNLQTINSFNARLVNEDSADVHRDWITNLANRVEGLHEERWKLTGVRVEHFGKIDVDDIESFLRNAPFTIRQLLNIIRNGKN